MNACTLRGPAPQVGRSHLCLLFALGVVAATTAVGDATNKPTPPSFAVQPRSLRLQEGQYARFEVVADGTLPLAYQWRVHGTNGTPANLDGAVGSVLVLENLASTGTNASRFSVAITNVAGAVTSIVASLDVIATVARELWLGPPVADGASRLVFPVNIVAQGNERQVSASLAFNTAVLRNPTFQKSTNATSALLATQTNQVAQGRFGFVYALKADPAAPLGIDSGNLALLPAGLFPLGNITLELVGEAGTIAGASLAWTNQPVAFEGRDATNGVQELAPFILPRLIPAAGPMVFNRQSGLYTQKLTVVNVGTTEIPGTRIYAHDITNTVGDIAVRLANANGYFDTIPYLESGPLAAAQEARLTAEYYVPDRRTMPAPAYEVRVAQPPIHQATGTQIVVDRILYTNGVFLVDFPSVPTRHYHVQYKRGRDLADLLVPWRTASPSVTALGSRTQWLDNGPPKTESIPDTNRFYRVFETLP
jgi:hypothetical protein